MLKITWRNARGLLIIVSVKLYPVFLQFTLFRNSGPINDSKSRALRHLFLIMNNELAAVLSLRIKKN